MPTDKQLHIESKLRRKAESELAVLRARLTAAEAELDKWRNWHPDDETLADAQRQAFMPNGDHGGSLAAMVVYVRVLEERIRRHEAEAGRLREVTDALRNYVAHYPECPRAKFAGDCSCGLHNYLARYAASPVTEPQAAQAGEREQLAEALIEWAADEQIDDGNFACIYCGREWKTGKGCKHAPDCLHLRAKALRAEAGGSEAGGG